MVDFLVVIEDLGVEDLVSLHRSAALGAMVEEDIEVVTEEDIVGDIMEVMLQDIIMDGTTIPEEIMEVIIGTIIEAMPHMEQPLGFFLVG